MYRYIFIGLLILANLSCQSQQAQTGNNSAENKVDSISNYTVNSKNSESNENINELIESFSDDSNIGVPHKNKIELSEFEKSKGNSVELRFYILTIYKEWKLKQTFEFEKNTFAPCAPKLKDFNNDGFKDISCVSAEAARGANEIRRLFIYDRKKDELVYIKNSEEHPNLLYNKELDCIDAQHFYGGNATVFLKIDGDMLREFAYVETVGTERKVYLVDKNGKEKLLRTDKVSEDELFERYTTFNPPRQYKAKELEK